METDDPDSLETFIKKISDSGGLKLTQEKIKNIVAILEDQCYVVSNIASLSKEDAITIKFPLGLWTLMHKSDVSSPKSNKRPADEIQNPRPEKKLKTYQKPIDSGMDEVRDWCRTHGYKADIFNIYVHNQFKY